MLKDITAQWLSSIIALLTPLLLIAILSRKYPKEDLGVFILMLSISGMFIAICDYGFNITSTREIVGSSIETTSSVIIQTYLIKSFLFILSTILILIFWNNEFENKGWTIPIYLFSITFYPSWYFTGKNRILQGSLISSFGKLISLLLVLVMLKSIKSIYEVLIYYSAGGIFSILISLFYLKRDINISGLHLRGEVINKFISNFKISSTSLIVAIYTALPGIIISYLSTKTELAAYLSMEKIYKSVEYLITSGLIILFPKFIYLFQEDKNEHLKTLYFFEKIIIVLAFCSIIFNLFWAMDILEIYYGFSLDVSSFEVILFALIPFIGAMAVLWGNLANLSMNRDHDFFRSLIIGASITIIIIILSARFLGSLSGAIGIFVGAAIITLLNRYHALKHLKSSS